MVCTLRSRQHLEQLMPNIRIQGFDFIRGYYCFNTLKYMNRRNKKIKKCIVFVTINFKIKIALIKMEREYTRILLSKFNSIFPIFFNFLNVYKSIKS